MTTWVSLTSSQASRWHIEAKRLALNLKQLVNGASTEEEFEDIPSDVAGSSGAIDVRLHIVVAMGPTI